MPADNSASTFWLLIDWGDTLMRDDSSADGPMVFWPQVEAVSGAVEVLTGLRSKWRLALATNADASDEPQIRAALKRVYLDQLIERIYCFRKIGHKKPSPEYFSFVVKDLGVPVNQIVMVGDSFDVDITGANQMGIRAIWLNERSNEIRSGERHRTIRKLVELPQVLEEFIC